MYIVYTIQDLEEVRNFSLFDPQPFSLIFDREREGGGGGGGRTERGIYTDTETAVDRERGIAKGRGKLK